MKWDIGQIKGILLLIKKIRRLYCCVLQIVLLLIPSEETDESDLILEVTAGVGGQEAMLFTAEMFDMYQHYAAYKNWSFEILEYMSSDIGK